MTYKKKAAVLSAIVVILAVVYILSFVLDPANRKSKAFAWLEKQFLVMADRIEISGMNGKSLLVRKNDIWFFSSENAELPVKQGRVEDLFTVLSSPQVYPLRASSSEARERLGLGEDSSSRIIVSGGAGLPLLDLLVGGGDALKREVYLRRAGWNDIYSGEDQFTYYTDAKPSSWYDLRLFSSNPENEASLNPGYDSIDAVQQAEVTLPESEPFMLRRSGNGWIMPASEALDATRIEGWLRSVLEGEADDFGSIAPETIEASITLWFGDGSMRTIEAGFLDENKNRSVRISGSPYTYVLGEWNYSRLFREMSYFFKITQ